MEMASAHVLSNSTNRKQDLLEAGKRRLEEFRKKKASDQAKTAASSQTYTSSSTADEKPALENEKTRLSNYGNASASSEPAYVVIENAEGQSGFSDSYELKPAISFDAFSSFADSFAAFLSEPPNLVKDEEHLRDGLTTVNEANVVLEQHSDVVVDSGNQTGEGKSIQGILLKSNVIYPYITGDKRSRNNEIGYYGLKGVQENENNGLGMKQLGLNIGIPDTVENMTSQRSSSIFLQNKADSICPGNDFQVPGPVSGRSILGAMDTNSGTVSGVEQRSSLDYTPSFLSDPVQVPESAHLGFNLGVGKSARHTAMSLVSTETTTRSRPSFLDSLNIPRAATSSVFPQHVPQKLESATIPSTSIIEPMLSENPILYMGVERPPTGWDSRNTHGSGRSIHDSVVERNLEPRSLMQNEDFTALEQHIEDLTQERFSLQRAIETSKALAESLAAENSSLTESYNQQASVVSQLKSEMEKLQKELKSQLDDLESMKIQYTNALLECNAADERAKLLASEVIGLEEKALRLRSNELKLEKELEKSTAELTSCKKKLSNMEKDRHTLYQTIDALKEETKLLLSRLQKASTSGGSLNSMKAHTMKDVSTTTVDIGDQDLSPVQGDSAGSLPPISIREGNDGGAPYLSDANADEEHDAFGFEASAIVIPPDHLQSIHSINSLIKELMTEKEEMARALVAEIAASSTLKDINKDLSHKLEVQTQRLDLLTTQSMKNENIPVRLDAPAIQDTASYADEGDEVVERVLGWIMKLFPRGPSRRMSI